MLVLPVPSSCQHSQNTLTNPNMAQPQNSEPKVEYEWVYYSDSTLIDSVARTIFARTNFDFVYRYHSVDSLAKIRGVPDSLFNNVENYQFLEMVDIWGFSFPLKKVVFLAKPSGELSHYFTEKLIIGVGGAVLLRYPEYLPNVSRKKPFMLNIRRYDGLYFSERVKQYIRERQQSENSAIGEGK